jgi:hypothetical protein
LQAEPSVYNVDNDDLEPVARWLLAFARWVGAPDPARISAEELFSRQAPKVSTATPG